MPIAKNDCAFWRAGQCNCKEVCRYSRPETRADLFIVLRYETMHVDSHCIPHIYGPFGQRSTAETWAREQAWIEWQVLPVEAP